MSKSCCFAVALAVICLPVILLSLEADAQPTVDETMSFGSSTLGNVVMEIKAEIAEVKNLLTEPSKQAVLALQSEYLVIFRVSRRRRQNVLWSRASVCLCVCLPVCGRMPTLLHGPGCNLGSGRGCPLVVHYWEDLQLVHGLRCYDNTRNGWQSSAVMRRPIA